ncbi:MAG TPA: DoxX family protein [Aeromicrobium sp.]|nr:DoxX family protein [Aeromicrobium sp.]
MAFAVVLAVALFAVSGLVKIVGAKASLEQRDALAVSPGLWRTIGVLELLGVIGVVGAWFGVLPLWLGQAAAVGFILLIIGAIVTRLRAKSPVGLILMDLVALTLSVLTLVVLRGR